MKENLLKNSKQELVDEIIKLRESEQKLREDLEEKDGKIKDLEGKLNTNMTNSGKPSSTEKFSKKKIINLRSISKKARGGQVGHTGKNLTRNENIDEVIKVTPEVCEKCGVNLFNGLSKIVRSVTRQVIDIDKLKTKVTDYEIKDIKCYNCGFVNKAIIPEGITKSVQYGSELKVFTSYMYNYQMPSYDRLQDFFKEVVGLDISQTSLCNFNKTGYENLESFEKLLKEVLVKQKLINADETGVRIDGKNNWVLVNSNQDLTYLFPHKKRGREAIEEMGILNNFKGNCITDGLQTYLAYDFEHYLCNVHHLRELTWVIENEKKKWAIEYNSFLMKYKKQRDTLLSKGILFFEKNILDDIHLEHEEILLKGRLEYTKVFKRKDGVRGKIKKEKGLNLLDRLEKKEKSVLGFLHDFINIPFDNNQAERDLRMIKTRTKISGCFRSEEGVKWFCRFRSYISTMKKQDIDVYPAIQSIFTGQLFLPEF